MTRFRIFFGAFFGLFGFPLFIYALMTPDLPAELAGGWVWSCSLCAFSVALLWPERWTR